MDGSDEAMQPRPVYVAAVDLSCKIFLIDYYAYLFEVVLIFFLY